MANETDDEILCITSVRKKKKVRLTMGDGTERELYLMEMMGLERDNYITKMKDRMVLDPNTGVPTGVFKDMKNIQATLIAECLYEEGSMTKVPIKEIEVLPSSTQATLARVCREMNGLDEGGQAAAKKV